MDRRRHPGRRASDKMLGEWFWTDRWMGSSAFLLPLEPRGLYREMLSQAWLRGARLPNSPEAVRRAVGCTEAEWGRCWPLIEGYWRVDGDSLVNDTQLEVYEESKAAQEESSRRGAKGAAARWKDAQADAQAMPVHMLKQCPLDPDPDLDLEQAQDGKTVSSVPKAAHEPVDDSPTVLTFPTIGNHGPEWRLSERQVAEWKALFPGLDVTSEARKALAWIQAQPERRKTTRGMRKFIVSWLTRTVDRAMPPAGVHGSGKTAGNFAAAAAFASRGQ
jgi:uncharacterized protein YdaU (DUF1376 family)